MLYQSQVCPHASDEDYLLGYECSIIFDGVTDKIRCLL